MYKMILMVAVVSVAFVGPSMAQDVAVAAPSANTVLPMCHIVLCQTDERCLLFDDKGNWLSGADVKHIYFDDGKQLVFWIAYKGKYKPTSIEVKKGLLKKKMSLTVADFQKMIDDLQKGDEVDLDRKKKEPSEE